MSQMSAAACKSDVCRRLQGPPAPVSRGYAAQARATGLALARAGAAAPAASRRRDPFLAVLFARRRRRLLRFLTAGARHDPPSVTPRLSGRTLLSLPEDVMVRNIIELTHFGRHEAQQDCRMSQMQHDASSTRLHGECQAAEHLSCSLAPSHHLTMESVCSQLVIICCLQHKEIGSLFGVCRELRATVRC